MFDDALLDSSPARTPVFKKTDWVLALSVGVGGFSAGFLLTPSGSLHPGAKVLAMPSAVLGVVLMLHTLMLCYV